MALVKPAEAAESARLPASSSARERRIAAVVLPELLSEIAWTAFATEVPKRRRMPPLGVVLVDDAASNSIKPTSQLDAVSPEARRFGVRDGQTITEACALVAKLEVRAVSREQVQNALGRIAEIALAFGPTVALELPDTVYVDITGAAHLLGGEAALASELASRVRAVGHVTRVAVAGGPRFARAFARWSSTAVSECGVTVVESARTASEFARLPVTALPLDGESLAWFARLGVLSVGDLAALPRSSVSGRLGERACVLELCDGRDSQPLVPYALPRILTEKTSWDDAVSGVEPLLFVLRGLAARMSARLAGRGEAAQRLRLIVEQDAAIARLRKTPPELVLEFELAAPLWREQELLRVVASRLEREVLGAPSIGLALEVNVLTVAAKKQLDLARLSSNLTVSCPGLEQLPVLLAELNADVGAEQIGVFEIVDSLRPENKCALVPALSPPKKRAAQASTLPKTSTMSWPNAPTRLLKDPVRLDSALCVGASVVIDHQLYAIEKMRFEQRLNAVEWWSDAPMARDYWRLWLTRQGVGLEAVVYVDRQTGTRFLQAIAD